jgi:hypothetical protein
LSDLGQTWVIDLVYDNNHVMLRVKKFVSGFRDCTIESLDLWISRKSRRVRFSNFHSLPLPKANIWFGDQIDIIACQAGGKSICFGRLFCREPVDKDISKKMCQGLHCILRLLSVGSIPGSCTRRTVWQWPFRVFADHMLRFRVTWLWRKVWHGPDKNWKTWV